MLASAFVSPRALANKVGVNMLENIIAKNFPQESGVYWFTDDKGECLYVGSSKDLYQRMDHHRRSIKKGFSGKNSQKDLYQFLQQNTFQVQFKLTENYKEEEQELIENYHPKFNKLRSFTGLGQAKDRHAAYSKDYYQKFRDEYLECNKKYIRQHKEEIDKYQNKYWNQKCEYNGKVLTLAALSRRFQRQGFSNPTLEAKKYLLQK